MADDRAPVPYTDEFHKAKRNSLVWSALTVAAAFGTPPAQRETVGVGQFGLNLGFDQATLVFLFWSVSIFTVIGFLEAYRRLRLYSSNLFAGSTDVEEAFATLNTSARRASNDIADLEKRIAAFLREESKVTSSVVGFLQDASNTLGSLSLVAPLPEFPMPSTTSTMEHPDRPYRIEAINAYREHLTSWFENQSSNLANASSHISQAIERIRPDVESLHKSFQEKR